MTRLAIIVALGISTWAAVNIFVNSLIAFVYVVFKIVNGM